MRSLSSANFARRGRNKLDHEKVVVQAGEKRVAGLDLAVPGPFLLPVPDCLELSLTMDGPQILRKMRQTETSAASSRCRIWATTGTGRCLSLWSGRKLSTSWLKDLGLPAVLTRASPQSGTLISVQMGSQ